MVSKWSACCAFACFLRLCNNLVYQVCLKSSDLLHTHLALAGMKIVVSVGTPNHPPRRPFSISSSNTGEDADVTTVALEWCCHQMTDVDDFCNWANLYASQPKPQVMPSKHPTAQFTSFIPLLPKPTQEALAPIVALRC